MLSIIVAKNGFKESSKPADLAEVDLWENDGWKVDARYVQVDKPIRYKDYMDDILALQGEKYAPFNSLGRGNTGYLFQVTDQLADYLFSLLELKLEDVVAVEKSEDELIEAEIIAVSDEPQETVREQVVKNRIGQGIFKQRLRALEEKCKLCGIDNPNLFKS